MRNQSFEKWLAEEISSIRNSLFKLYEMKDNLLFVDAVALRKEYIYKIGNFEERILEAELDVTILREKLKLIQIAINRREPIDMDVINEKLRIKKEELISFIEDQDLVLKSEVELSEEDCKKMQQMYRRIIKEFHPALYTNITDTQKELYEKAMEAYRKQNLEELTIIYDMLFADEYIGIACGNNNQIGKSENNEDNEDETTCKKLAQFFKTDYSLAKQIFPLFRKHEDDVVFLTTIEKYQNEKTKLEKDIENIKKSFPFNAKEMLKDQAKIDEYLSELKIRGKTAENDKIELEDSINKLIGVEQDG